MASASDRPAPGDLAVVQAFINTADLMHHADEIAQPDALARWFEEHGLGIGDLAPTHADVRRAAELREALRKLASVNSGASIDREAVDVANRAIRSAQLSFTFGSDCEGRFEPAARGIDGALGRIVGFVADAMSHGGWTRMKACPDEKCLWAFYDYSKNRSGKWCAMGACGNRAKARTFRARRRSHTTESA